METELSEAALWGAVIGLGAFHGLNPGMGWPLSVSAGLMAQRTQALLSALVLLGLGHFLAMTIVLLPFSTMIALVDWQREVQIVAGLFVAAVGLFLLLSRRHPRFLARVRPERLALWSFLAALAHGAGFMLLPIYLGICRIDELDIGHQAASELMAENALAALSVAAVHTAAMIVAGGIVAGAVYRLLGLKFLSRSWFNVEALWAASLVLVGGLGVAAAA
ncbi:MAG: hypothetical protein AAF636_17370 [Pseudomonadota bacterium]